jgi:hypothetical protein
VGRVLCLSLAVWPCRWKVQEGQPNNSDFEVNAARLLAEQLQQETTPQAPQVCTGKGCGLTWITLCA